MIIAIRSFFIILLIEWVSIALLNAEMKAIKEKETRIIRMLEYKDVFYVEKNLKVMIKGENIAPLSAFILLIDQKLNVLIAKRNL